MNARKPFFSIGIIFKDEIRCLERCLRSLQPLQDAVSCEIVMADTGSTDGSREVAEKYADVLFDFPWINDFSAARNAVMDRCSGQWYLSIDADEWLSEDIRELVAFSKAKKLPRDFAGLTIRNYKDVKLEQSKHYVDFTATRLAKLSTGMRYTGCIHEAWLNPNGQPLMISVLGNTMLYHDGYVYFGDEEAHAKLDRNMALLKKKLADNPQDLQTLVECMDSAKHLDSSSAEYARQAVEGIRQKWKRWDRLGPVVYRNVVSIGKIHKLPELKEWISWAEEHYPASIFTRIDVYYYAMVNSWEEDDYENCVRWGEMYREGLRDYRNGNYDINEPMCGVLEYASPHWERRLLIMLSEAHLNCNQPEKAFTALRDIKGEELDEVDQVEACANMLVRLQRTTSLDLSELVSKFWTGINQPVPSKELSQKRRAAFQKIVARTFAAKYLQEEREREDFVRHGYCLCCSLGENCGLKSAAEILNSEDPAFQEEQLREIENWEEFPIQVLAHALCCGSEFPQPSKPLTLETMDYLAEQLGWLTEELPELFLRQVKEQMDTTLQKLAWIRGLAIVVVRGFEWSREDKVPLGLELARNFGQVIKTYLPRCYAAEILRGDNLLALPLFHRFGWHCAQAFETLDAGDTVGYVQMLRTGLETCTEMKPMVEFLLKHTPELQTPAPSEELKSLAEQIRTVLSRFSPEDPAVTALKQSEAYRKVAHLIEGIEVPVVGGLKQ